MTKKYEGEVILDLGKSACKLAGYKPSPNSSFIVCNKIIEVTGKEAKEGDELTIAHIPTGLTITPVIPENVKTQSQLLLFARWLEEAAKEELKVVDKITFQQRQHTVESERATNSLKEIAMAYQKGH